MSLCARAPQFVRIPPGSSAHTFTPKGATSWASDSVNPPTAHLAAWYPALPGRARRPPIDERLESLRAQLLERCNIAVARVVHDYVETPERVHRYLHCCIGRILICDVEGSGANLIAVLLH